MRLMYYFQGGRAVKGEAERQAEGRVASTGKVFKGDYVQTAARLECHCLVYQL